MKRIEFAITMIEKLFAVEKTVLELEKQINIIESKQ